MPIISHASGSGVPACWLLAELPDWGRGGVKIAYGLASEQAEALTGIEGRMAGHRALRLRVEWTWFFTPTEADQWRKMLPLLAGARVGVPLWPDADRTEPWLHTPQKVLSWNDAGGYAITAVGGPYAHPHSAPLMLGRLTERPKLMPAGKVGAIVRMVVEEDAPFDLRIEPASGAAPGSFALEPDWAQPLGDISRDQLRDTQLGQGREAGIAGGDGTPRWGQEAGFSLDRTETADLLRLWLDRQGSVKPFSIGVWFQPGSATADTPDTLTARFDRDVIELHYTTPTIAGTTLRFWEEVTLSPPADQFADSLAWIYELAWEGGSTLRLTSWEHDLSHAAQTWTPVAGGIAHKNLRLTLKPIGDEVDVSIFAGMTGNPLSEMLAGEAERRLRVTITEVRVSSAGTVTSSAELFSGEILRARAEEDVLVGEAKSFGGIFRRKLPRFLIQKGCNYALFEPSCGLAKASWSKTGPLGGTFPTASVSFTPGVPPSGTYAQKWFAGGWLEVTGSDAKFHRRAILDSSETAGVWTLSLNRWLPATCDGATATCYPGCDGNYSTCVSKFANGLNFGGHPFTPDFISTAEGSGGGKVK